MPMPRHTSWSIFLILSLIALSICVAGAQRPARDAVQAKPRPRGDEWRPLSGTYGFTDAACAAEGNFFFSDLRSNAIYRVRAYTSVSVWFSNAPSISGMKYGPGRLFYAATQAPKKQIITIRFANRDIAVLADDVEPNDLVVTDKRFVYFTETAKGRVMVLDPQNNLTIGAVGINGPNGIALWEDQQTLAVSEYRGTNIWTFHIEADGRLSAGKRAMTLRVPAGRTDSGGDGMTCSIRGDRGHLLVTSHLGIQAFDSAGRLVGLIPKPSAQPCVSFSPGAGLFFACSGDKVYWSMGQGMIKPFEQPNSSAPRE